MSGEILLIAFILAVAMLAALIAKLASFLQRFAANTRYICHEMECAVGYDEYRRWRGELRCHYLCLIPFVNKNNVMRLYNRIYHKADKEQKERKDSLVPLLLPSVLGICLCLVCVCSMTWAWYSASVETPKQKLTAAYYEVSVGSITDTTDTTDGTVIPVDGKYHLDADIPYTVELTASGSVNKWGYCLIQNTVTGEKIYTQTFSPGQTITITLIPTAGEYTFTGVWGSLPIGTEKYLLDKDAVNPPVNGDPDPEPESSDTTESAPAESSPAEDESVDGDRD